MEEVSGDTWARDFYPRSPCGERLLPHHARKIIKNNFYPRSPCGERHVCQLLLNRLFVYFYPRSPCGERPFEKFEGVIATKISIHALLAESDGPKPEAYPSEPDISIHALLAESDPYAKKFGFCDLISIHALLAESDMFIFCSMINTNIISIHALLAESDRELV